MRLELSLPPSANKQYRRTKGGGVALTPQVKSFRREVWALFKQQRKRPIYGPVRLEVHLYPSRAGRFDADNRIKQLQDALQDAGAFADDSQINDLHVKKYQPEPPLGRCVVEIFEIR